MTRCGVALVAALPLVLLVLAALLLPSAALCEPARAELATHLLESDRLLGDPGGRRSRLEELGIDLQLFYHHYLAVKASGGGQDSRSEVGNSGSYDFFTRVDLEELSGWRGADLLLRVKGQHEDGVNEEVGALSDPVDDADFDSGIYIDELWLQQAVFQDRVRARLGFVEQQTVFDRNAYANSEDRQFLASFLDNNAVVPLPNGLGATLFVTPTNWFELAVGVADADGRARRAGFDTFFDGVNSLTGYAEARVRSPWDGTLRVGVFRDGRRLFDFETGRPDQGHTGFYLNADHRVWRERGNDPQGLGVFARVGHADPDVNRVAWFWSVGFEYVGSIPGRDRDVLGFGCYQTIASDEYQDEVDSSFDRETGFELYYAVQALGWLVITPDLQYIVDPGATGANDDALVATLRLRVEF